jgi:hypothetical protein
MVTNTKSKGILFGGIDVELGKQVRTVAYI